MKKRFSIPLGLVAGFVALSFFVDGQVNEMVAKCNAGDQAACNKIIETYPSVWDEVTETGAKQKIAKLQAEKAKAEAEANKWKPTNKNISDLAWACGYDNVKPFLKDPNSFRELGRGMSELTDTHVTVWVKYTATNSFGGRVQDTKTCKYSS